MAKLLDIIFGRHDPYAKEKGNLVSLAKKIGIAKPVELSGGLVSEDRKVGVYPKAHFNDRFYKSGEIFSLKLTVVEYDSLSREGGKVGTGKNWYDAALFDKVISSLDRIKLKYRIILAENGDYPALIETDDAVITIEHEK